MRGLLPLTLLFSFQSFADVCQTDIFAKKCFEIDQPSDLTLLYPSADSLKEEYCKIKCQPDMTSLISPSSNEIRDIKSEQASFVMNEVQKGMTEIMMDLLKVRSGFALQGSADSAIKSCNLDLIQIPDCFKGTINSKISELKKGMALEIKNILAGEKIKESFLMNRTSEIVTNTCEAKESNILMAKTLNILDSITDEKIAQFKNAPSDTSELALADYKTSPLLKTIFESEQLKKEFYSLDSEKRKSFVFGSKVGEAFFKRTQDNCDHIIKKSSEAFNLISCDQEIKFKNQTITSFEKNKDFNFSDPKLTKEKALVHIQNLCKEVLVYPDQAKDLSELLQSVLPNQSGNSTKSLNRFKEDIHKHNIANNQILISEARAKNETNTIGAELLKHCESLMNDETHKELAKGSNDNINKILQSMIQDAPMDQETKVVLIREGILPDPKNEVKPTPATSVAKFDEKVRNSTSSSTTVKQASIKPNVNSAAAASSSQSQDYSQDYTQPMANVSGNSAREIAVDETTDNEVRNLIPRMDKLSQSQKDLLNDFAKRQNSVKGTKSNKASNETQVANLPSMGMGSSLNNSVSSEDSQQVSSGKPFEHEGTAKLSDDKRVKDSFNDALNRANESRSPASLSNASAQVSLSTSGSEKVVDIKVPEQNLLVVESFKNELKNLLELKDSEFSMIQTGETILVKINNYEVKVIFDKKSGQYIARCDDEKFPDSYEEVIKNYFNKTLLKDRARRSELVKSLPN